MFLIVLAAACSWEKSDQARDILYQIDDLMSADGKKMYDLPQSCPFKHALHKDMLKPVQDKFSKVTTITFECNICGKVFREKENIQRHLLKHTDGGLCLADLCLFLPCTPSDLIIDRCKSVMFSCFEGKFALDLYDRICLQEDRESEAIVLQMTKAGYVMLGIVAGLLSLSYYLIIWSEFENGRTVKVKKLKKM